VNVKDARDPAPATRGSYAIAATLFLLGGLVLASPWLSGALTIPWDAKAQAWPQIAFLARSLASGESPFWTPNVFAGHPQVADPQSQIFSPPYLLLAWLDPRPSFRAADSVTFAMLALAGLCIISWFRDHRWHAAGALVAAFAFAFGGSAAWRIQHVGEVMSLSWFAIAWLLLDRALVRGSIAYGLVAGIVAGFMVLGRDQIAYLCTLILAGSVAWHLLAGPGRGSRLRAATLPLLAGLVGGVLVVTVPLALTLSLAMNSNRPEIDFVDAGRGSLPPLSFLTAIVANLFGVDGPLKDYWGPPNSDVWGANDLALARNMVTVYFGALPVVALLTVGLAGGGLLRRPVRFAALAMVAMALFAVGRYTPAFRLFYEIPGVSLYRRPADATFPLCALAAIVAGYCIHRLLEKPPGRAVLAAGAVLTALALAACLFVAADKGRLAQAGAPLALGVAVFVASLALVATLPWLARRAPFTALGAIAILMVFDLAFSNKPNESTALPPSAYDVLQFGTQNETIALIKSKLAETAAPDRRDRVELAAVDFEWPGVGLVHDFDHDLGYNPVRLKLFTDATHAIDQIAIPEQRVFSPLYAHFRSPLADLLGVRFVLSRYPLERMDKDFKPGDLDFVTHTKDAFVWENPRALPRVLLATQARAADFDRMLVDGQWPDLDPRTTVLLPSVTEVDARPRAPGTVRLVSYRNTVVEVEATAPEGGIVVLNDVWQPWWRAEVDGAPAEILRANVMFRAVRVPPGTHRVRFSFHPFAGVWREWMGQKP
jgi:hypothetical protein